MLIVFSVNGVPIRLTDERWKHIVDKHVEMSNEKERVLETISNPELIQKGDFGTLLAIRKYRDTPVTDNKFLVVAYKELGTTDGLF